MSSVEIPFHNPKTRILCYIGKNQTIGVGSINELSRETGINDVEKTEARVQELIDEKLLKRADPKTDMTILKLTYRSSMMLCSFLFGNRRWYWRIQPIIGLFLIAAGILSISVFYLLSHDFVLGFLNGLIYIPFGIYYLALWWFSTKYSQRKSLELDRST